MREISEKKTSIERLKDYYKGLYHKGYMLIRKGKPDIFVTEVPPQTY